MTTRKLNGEISKDLLKITNWYIGFVPKKCEQEIVKLVKNYMVRAAVDSEYQKAVLPIK